MDRQAWIAVTLCVIGLVLWQVYVTSYAPPPRPAPSATPAVSPAPDAQAATETTPAPSAAAAATTTAAAPSPTAEVETFDEVIEPLRNSDVELRVTNRGGGISEAHLLNHRAQHGEGV